MLRVPTGAALGVIAWLLVWSAFLSPGAPFATIPAAGLAGISLIAGFVSGRATTRLQDLFATLLALNDVVNGPAKPPTAPPLAENEKPPPTDADLDSAVAEAELVLRGKNLAADDIYKLAEFLKQRNKFGHARRLYGRLWEGHWSDLRSRRRRSGSAMR